MKPALSHKCYDLLTHIRSKQFLVKFVKYLLVGGSAALINWLIFYTAITFNMWYIYAGLLSFVLATLWNFILARLFIFKASQHSLLKESTLVYLVSLGGLLIDIGILFVGVDLLECNAMLSKIIATGVAFIFNFSLRYGVIYKSHISHKGA
ncbi:GtrA family protein [Helicobacter jaachi]|uniref:GtrA family protein n=1 Tax=Helicobacter jaachi TaxID=1677920 RepID=A0A4U8TC26_9HELI|nr:GtrA family protein [Helicobacter jaachi]TLD97479.1 GtrA family protein [Helicobacter jaachi]